MAAVGDPLGRMQAKIARRLRRFTVYHAAVVVVALSALAWILLLSGVPTFLWTFVVLVILMVAGIPLVWWLNRRNFDRMMSGFEAFRPRITDAKLSLNSGYLLILDNGLVLGVDPRTSALRFLAFFSAGGALLHPEMAQAERWGTRIRGMQTEGAITGKKGPADAQAALERFRVAFGAKWYLLFLRQLKPDRMVAGDPMWHEVLAFFIPKWWNQARAVAGELDPLMTFLQTAKTQYFPRSAESR